MKKILMLNGFMLFCMTLAILASHLSSDATALVIGLIFGWIAGLPSALFLLAIVRRKQNNGPPFALTGRPPHTPAACLTSPQPQLQCSAHPCDCRRW